MASIIVFAGLSMIINGSIFSNVISDPTYGSIGNTVSDPISRNIEHTESEITSGTQELV